MMIPDAFVEDVARGDRSIQNAFDNLSNVTAAFVASFEPCATEVPSCSGLSDQGAELAVHIDNHLGITQWLLGTRMRHQLTDFVSALLEKRVFLAALVGRAIVETAAACVYWEERLQSTLREEPHDATKLLEELHLMATGGRFDWIGMQETNVAKEGLKLYARGKDSEVPEDRRAPNVMTMLARLDRRMAPHGEAGAVRAVHAMLSDFCHPAVGTALILTEPCDRPGVIRVKGATDMRETRWFFWNMGAIIGPVAMVALTSLRALAARHGSPKT